MTKNSYHRWIVFDLEQEYPFRRTAADPVQALRKHLDDPNLNLALTDEGQTYYVWDIVYPYTKPSVFTVTKPGEYTIIQTA